ncbi:helix-turn-helix domain-containing protein [Nonomuraea wenchangensis]
MVLDHVSGRWAVLVLTALRDGPQRFHELRAEVEGVSEKMLSQTLRTLVRDGFVHRTVKPSTPPQVSYALTGLGGGVTGAVQPLFDWVRDHADDILAAQAAHDAAASG